MVWFRADPARNEDCRRALRELVQRLASTHGVHGRFGWRDETDGRYRTWLESYEPMDVDRCPAFIDALQAQASALGLDALATGERFTEVFQWSA